MDVKRLSKQKLSEILENAFMVVYSGENWNTVFPEISGYDYSFPDNYYDMEEHPNSFRGDDHVVAHATVQYPELYPQIEKLIKAIYMRNKIIEPYMSGVYEYAGTHYIVELVLKDIKYMDLYTIFLSSNPADRYQGFDFVRMVQRWGWIYETYYLLFNRFFWERSTFDDDMDYLNYSVSSLMNGHFENETERNIFFKAIQDYLIKLGLDPSDKDYNETLAVDFENMVLKHFAPRNFDFAKMMKDRYLNILNNPDQEIDNSQKSVEIITEDIIQYVEEVLPEI